MNTEAIINRIMAPGVVASVVFDGQAMVAASAAAPGDELAATMRQAITLARVADDTLSPISRVIRVIVANYTIVVEVHTDGALAAAIVTGDGVAKSLRRLMRRAWKAGQVRSGATVRISSEYLPRENDP